ncbi:MAG: glycoside hydrolase family 3 N-terminal domain-containing protein [Pelagibacteraceae bacterium]
MKKKAIIISIANYFLSNKEKKMIKDGNPWGVILFKRNIKSFNQTKKLIDNIKRCSNDKKFPILIDEEGGNVCRMSNFLDNRIYSQNFFGSIYKKDKILAKYLYKNYIFSLSAVFHLLGININTVPVLDLIKKKTHKIIGNRSYGSNSEIIKDLGIYSIKEYKKNKIGNVIKHIPGHGSALADSHKKLPIVTANYKSLKKLDFECFKNVNSQFAMTAHILYKKIDPIHPATHSSKIIKNIIRKKIKFKGILISDDISMKALKHDLVTNAKLSLNAGCNLVLYCGGNYKESNKLLNELPTIDKFTAKKTSEFYRFLS